MKLFELLRQKAFWMCDAMKGGPIRRQLSDIETIMDSSLENNDYLPNILDYVTKNIPYYKKFDKWSRLEDFPIVNKSIIRNNEEQFINPTLDRKTLTARETSGSTGMPFVLYQDPIKRQRATADTLWFSQKAHYELGTRLYFSRVWDKKTTRSAWQCLKQNWVLHDASALSDAALQQFLHQLETDNSTKSVIIFASSLTAIAKYLERNDMTPQATIESFITVSESLPLWTKKIIERRFRAPVFSRYSDEELGILAQQVEESNDYIVNRASFHIELLEMDSEKPVADGEEGRVVVTDLFNRAMPLIRYDTGDIATFKAASNRSMLEKVGGRRVDCIWDTKGELVSPYVINTPMHEYLEIQQYQFIQDGERNYTMLLNMKNSEAFSRKDKMTAMLKSYLGQDAEITVKYVDEIPVLKSGKRKQVVNNYKPV